MIGSPPRSTIRKDAGLYGYERALTTATRSDGTAVHAYVYALTPNQPR